MIIKILAVIGAISLVVMLLFSICVYKVFRYSEVGAIDLEDVE
jgi:hypothetical protein